MDLARHKDPTGHDTYLVLAQKTGRHRAKPYWRALTVAGEPFLLPRVLLNGTMLLSPFSRAHHQPEDDSDVMLVVPYDPSSPNHAVRVGSSLGVTIHPVETSPTYQLLRLRLHPQRFGLCLCGSSVGETDLQSLRPHVLLPAGMNAMDVLDPGYNQLRLTPTVGSQ